MKMKTYTHTHRNKPKLQIPYKLLTAHTNTMCTVSHTVRIKLYPKTTREFSHISESHKSPSLATSSEGTADIYINITTAKRPMEGCNRSIIAEWDEEGAAASFSQQRLEAFFNINTRIIKGSTYPSFFFVKSTPSCFSEKMKNEMLIFSEQQQLWEMHRDPAPAGRYQTETNVHPWTGSDSSNPHSECTNVQKHRYMALLD